MHRLREGFKAERTACINRIRGLLAEFGLVFAQKPCVLREALPDAIEAADNELGFVARLALQRAQQQWEELDQHLEWCDQRIAQHHKDNEQVRQAERLTGVGPVTASALVATVGDFKQFRDGAQFGAWLGLTPRQNSSGSKNNLGRITKRGDNWHEPRVRPSDRLTDRGGVGSVTFATLGRSCGKVQRTWNLTRATSGRTRPGLPLSSTP